MLIGFASAQLNTNALGGWLATIVHHHDESKLSSWTWAACFAGNGLMAILAGELVRALPLQLAAILLGLIVFIPTAIFLVMPSPGPDRRLARESFGKFFGEVFAVIRRREVLIALALFASPCASFALTNTLGSFGNDFHASARMVSRRRRRRPLARRHLRQPHLRSLRQTPSPPPSLSRHRSRRRPLHHQPPSPPPHPLHLRHRA